MLFDFIPGRDVVVRPSGGQLTCDAGLLAVRQFDERVKWTARFAGCLGDDRQTAVHSTLSMVRQRIYGILAGYEDCNDHDALRRLGPLQAVDPSPMGLVPIAPAEVQAPTEQQLP